MLTWLKNFSSPISNIFRELFKVTISQNNNISLIFDCNLS